MAQALLQACDTGQIDVIRALLSSGHAFDFNTPLVLAKTQQSHSSTAPEAELPIHLLAKFGKAAQHHHGRDTELALDLCLHMVEQGASLTARDGRGATAIEALTAFHPNPRLSVIFSKLEGHPEFNHATLRDVLIVQKAGLDPTTLMGMSAQVDIDAIKILMKAGFPINEPDALGRLPVGYAMRAEDFSSLAALGADVSLEDNHGLAAIDRARSISDPTVRDRSVATLAMLRHAAQGQPGPALEDLLRLKDFKQVLQAARQHTKQTLLRTVSLAKIKPETVRDPFTGSTALMEAFKGGRLSSAQWLLDKGSSLMERDAEGRPACAWLFCAQPLASGSSTPNTLLLKHWNTIDWLTRSESGWTLAAFAAEAAAGSRTSWPERFSFKADLLGTALKRLLQEGTRLPPSAMHSPDGRGLAQIYVEEHARCNQPSRRSHRISEDLLDFALLCDRFDPAAGQVDWTMREMLRALANAAGPDYQGTVDSYLWRELSFYASKVDAREHPDLPPMPLCGAFLLARERLLPILSRVAPEFPSLPAMAMAQRLELQEAAPNHHSSTRHSPRI